MSARAGAASVIAAIGAAAASICCVPLAAGILGGGAAIAGAAMAPLRPLLGLTSLGFLGFAFYRTYARPNQCDDGCGRRASTSARVLLWILTALSLLLLTFDRWSSHVIYWFL